MLRRAQFGSPQRFRRTAETCFGIVSSPPPFEEHIERMTAKKLFQYAEQCVAYLMANKDPIYGMSERLDLEGDWMAATAWCEAGAGDWYMTLHDAQQCIRRIEQLGEE